jgi:hypothetical protein
MRETRLSGSEGGGIEFNRFSLPLSTPDTSPAKPFTQEQVSNMVRDGFGDESGAKLIEQRGVDFAPAEDLNLPMRKRKEARKP